MSGFGSVCNTRHRRAGLRIADKFQLRGSVLSALKGHGSPCDKSLSSAGGGAAAREAGTDRQCHALPLSIGLAGRRTARPLHGVPMALAVPAALGEEAYARKMAGGGGQRPNGHS